MPIGIRCKQCQQKIILDEAFIGGYCRCPHCKSLTLAPAAGLDRGVANRPDRPAVPTTTAEAPPPGDGPEVTRVQDELTAEEFSPSPVQMPFHARPMPSPGGRKWIILAIALLALVVLATLYTIFVRTP
jgi:hypothetical protein